GAWRSVGGCLQSGCWSFLAGEQAPSTLPLTRWLGVTGGTGKRLGGVRARARGARHLVTGHLVADTSSNPQARSCSRSETTRSARPARCPPARCRPRGAAREVPDTS